MLILQKSQIFLAEGLNIMSLSIFYISTGFNLGLSVFSWQQLLWCGFAGNSVGNKDVLALSERAVCQGLPALVLQFSVSSSCTDLPAAASVPCSRAQQSHASLPVLTGVRSNPKHKPTHQGAWEELWIILCLHQFHLCKLLLDILPLEKAGISGITMWLKRVTFKVDCWDLWWKCSPAWHRQQKSSL